MIKMTIKREENGWSRNELARRAKLTPSDVGKIESGRLVPYDSQLKKLARAFGIPIKERSYLMEEVLL